MMKNFSDLPTRPDTAADAPINLPIQDRLGRNSFAMGLARRIYNKTDMENGFVIGIEGPWGSGKTSAINLTLHNLRHLQMHEQSSGSLFHGDPGHEMPIGELDEIAPDFKRISDYFDYPNYELSYMNSDHFNRTAARILGSSTETEWEALYRYFRLDLLYRKAPRNLVVHFSPWLIPSGASLPAAFIADLAKSIGSLLGTNIESALGEYAVAIANLLPVAGMVANLQAPGFGKALQAGAEWLTKSVKTDKSLESMKSQLESELRRLHDTKIIIVIDDLDRLTADEARQMISLVKGLGRLPNVLYLLSYDVDILAKHLDTHVGENGSRYLEKIVQTQYRLPLIRGNALLELLNPFLIEGRVKRTAKVNDRFREVWQEYGRYVVVTPRDVNRIGNAFALSNANLADFTDAADLFLLEILNAKNHVLYSFIRTNLGVLCGNNGIFPNGAERTLSKLVESISLAPESLEATALSLLFPAAAKEFGNPGSDIEPSARIEKRLHIFANSHAYFEMAPPQDELEASFLQQAFNSEEPLNELRQVIQRSNILSKPQLRVEFLEALRVEFAERDMPLSWLRALTIESGTLLRTRDATGGFMTYSDNLERLMSLFAKQIQRVSEGERANWMTYLLGQAEDYSFLFALARRMLPDINPAGRGTGTALGGQDKAMRSVFMKTLEGLLDPPAIWDQAQAQYLLWFWWGSTSGSELREFVTENLHLDQAFPHIVDALCSLVQSTTGNYEYISKGARQLVDWDTIMRFADSVVVDTTSPIREHGKRLLDASKNDEDGPLGA